LVIAPKLQKIEACDGDAGQPVAQGQGTADATTKTFRGVKAVNHLANPPKGVSKPRRD
jgi:hypothetical protein